MASVLTIIILLFGLIGYSYLGVREFPSVDNPIISVTCSYPGANADVIENQITEPLEQNINGIPGIRSLSSVSSQGQSRITVEFELSVDLETAANDVRDKVSRAQRYLPRDCDPPTVTKADADASPILMVTIQSDKRSLLELSEIADLTVKEQLQTINNVSGVQIWGEKRYSMRLWLDPAKMAGYGITPVDIKNALDRENVELPSGSIEGNTTELTIRTMGLMHTTQEFNDLVVREASNRIIRALAFGGTLRGGVIYGAIPLRAALLGAAAAAFMPRSIRKILSRRVRNEQIVHIKYEFAAPNSNRCEKNKSSHESKSSGITILKRDKRIFSAECLGIIDTGNALSEPISGLPVIVLGAKRHSEFAQAANVPIPMRTAAGESLLFGLKPKKLLINGCPVEAILAVGAKLDAALVPAVLAVDAARPQRSANLP